MTVSEIDARLSNISGYRHTTSSESDVKVRLNRHKYEDEHIFAIQPVSPGELSLADGNGLFPESVNRVSNGCNLFQWKAKKYGFTLHNPKIMMGTATDESGNSNADNLNQIGTEVEGASPTLKSVEDSAQFLGNSYRFPPPSAYVKDIIGPNGGPDPILGTENSDWTPGLITMKFIKKIDDRTQKFFDDEHKVSDVEREEWRAIFERERSTTNPAVETENDGSSEGAPPGLTNSESNVSEDVGQLYILDPYRAIKNAKARLDAVIPEDILKKKNSLDEENVDSDDGDELNMENSSSAKPKDGFSIKDVSWEKKKSQMWQLNCDKHWNGANTIQQCRDKMDFVTRGLTSDWIKVEPTEFRKCFGWYDSPSPQGHIDKMGGVSNFLTVEKEQNLASIEEEGFVKGTHKKFEILPIEPGKGGSKKPNIFSISGDSNDSINGLQAMQDSIDIAKNIQLHLDAAEKKRFYLTGHGEEPDPLLEFNPKTAPHAFIGAEDAAINCLPVGCRNKNLAANSFPNPLQHKVHLCAVVEYGKMTKHAVKPTSLNTTYSESDSNTTPPPQSKCQW